MTINTALHKNIMLQILKDIYSDATIAPCLGFKGGTAALMFYDLNRFSVDLDFDLLDESKEEYVFARIEQIAKGYGQIKDARIKRFNLFFLLSYGEKEHNIKVEINRRVFDSKYELKTYLGISMLVMTKEDMFAHKLMAMIERIGKANRDIFDVWFFLKNNWPINREIVEKRANMPFPELLQKCITSLESTDDRNILSGIGELVDAKQKVWAKKSLRPDTIFLLKVMLENEQNYKAKL